MNDVKQRVQAFIVENFLFGQFNGLSDDASFLKLGLLDSTGVLELVAFLQETFAVTVLDEEILPENLDSLNAIETFTQRKLAGQYSLAGQAGGSR